MLRDLLALPPENRVLLCRDDPALGGLPPDRTKALAVAYASRPEAKVARHAIEHARLELAAAERAWIPRIDVASRLGAEDAEARLSPVAPNWSVGVALSMNLFDGGVRRANVQAAIAALDAVTEGDRATLLAIALDVEAAYLRRDEARARIAVATRALALARETLDQVTIQYRGGAATISRYLEAEAALARARSAHVQATIDVLRTDIDAARAIGALADGLATGETT
jgi:outer membrane protein TolC